MSNAKPMRPVKRLTNYKIQEAVRADNIRNEKRPLTGPQKRRIKHKNHKMLGAAGGGTVKPKQVKNRQRRPAPVPGGLRMLLSPSQVRKRVQMRSAMTGIKFNLKNRRPDVMIIDDPIRTGNGDR